MSFYAVLGIPRDADAETIRNAYRILVRRYHPDSGPGSSVEKFRQVVEAYETLIDPARRLIYDRSLYPRHSTTMTPPEPLAQQPHGMPYRSVYRMDRLFGKLIRVLDDDEPFPDPPLCASRPPHPR